MRLHRSSAPFPRGTRRRSGCASLLVVLLLVGGVSGLTWRLLDRHRLPVPTAPGDPLLDGLAAYARGDLDAAVSAGRLAVARQPGTVDAARLLVRALVYRSYEDATGERDQAAAVDAAADLLARQPANPAALAVHAFALQAAGRPFEAADSALAALEIAPTDALARTALAFAYSSAGAHEAALRHAVQAAQDAAANPADRATQIDALRALAVAYRNQSQYANALEAIDAALLLNEHLLALHFERAAYALQISDYNAATVAYYQVLVYAPENVKARLRLCELSSLLREHTAAVRYCTEVIDRAPGWAEGWYRLGREYFLNGDFAAALTHLQQCSRLQVIQNVPPADLRFECWYLQGQAAEIVGDCPALRAIYREFQTLAIDEAAKQTWVYPPEGPPGCSFFGS